MLIRRPLLREVNNALIDVFGYCIVPLGDVVETTQNTKKGSIWRFFPPSLRDQRTLANQFGFERSREFLRIFRLLSRHRTAISATLPIWANSSGRWFFCI